MGGIAIKLNKRVLSKYGRILSSKSATPEEKRLAASALGAKGGSSSDKPKIKIKLKQS